LRQPASVARDRAANPVEQRVIRQYIHARQSFEPKPPVSTASDQLHQHSRRRQIPIAPAALSVPNTPRFPALVLFGRRPQQRGDGLVIAGIRKASHKLPLALRKKIGRHSSPRAKQESDLAAIRCMKIGAIRSGGVPAGDGSSDAPGPTSWIRPGRLHATRGGRTSLRRSREQAS